MWEFFYKLLDTSDFPARWHCGNWSAGHGWLHVVSDLGIFGAYAAIPVVLVYFVVRRRDLPFPPVFWLFAAFILSCGIGHLIEATIFWQPWYRLSGVVKLGTALVSWATVAVMIPIVPKVLAFRSPRELEALNQKLREEIAEREVLAEKLREASHEAQAANRTKSEFLANMSHEIRTPMNAIIGLTELVLQKESDYEQRDYLDTVLDSAESLLNIINDVLDFSRLEAGKFGLEEARFHLHDMVGDTLRVLAPRAQRKGVELACFIDPELPEWWIGDPGRLRQVLTNLVGNAIKFTDEGEIVARVERDNADGETTAESTQALRFSIRDTGTGIADADQDTIFEAFQQADASSTRRFGGTGLGLTISSTLVELMGGRIWVESELGEGSTFSFVVPMEVVESAVPRAKPLPLKDLKVLIVDDNPTNCTILEQVTQAQGMRPHAEYSALAAFRELKDAARRGEPYRLVLADVNMPEWDGYALAEMIRADEQISDIDILFLTSAGYSGELARCEELRIAARLMKPVKQSELFKVLARTLGLAESTENGWIRLMKKQKTLSRPLHILLAEDSVPNQKLALALLRGEGHKVVLANNGEEALERFAEQPFDLVLMDIQMPKLDGIQATAAIRAQEKESGRHTPIVAMTAHAMKGDREKFLRAGMDAYIAKPIRVEGVLSTLARLIPSEEEAKSPEVSSPTNGDLRINWSTLERQVSGDRELMREIVEAYMEEIRIILERLPQCIEDKDDREVRRLTHTLKSAMRTFGMTRAYTLAVSLESQAARGVLTGASHLLAELEQVIEPLFPRLKAFVDTGDIPLSS